MFRLLVLSFFPLFLPAQEFTQRDASVPMRDGVKLASTVFLPSRPGPYATLLVRTPYNRGGVSRLATYLAGRGYAVMTQDCRGRFQSEGSFYAFVNEGEDGYDTIEWIAKQPWSNGKVGTFGGSYLAWDQLYTAAFQPPHLSAMFLIVGGSNFYQDYAFPGGAPNLGWSMWLAQSALTSKQAASDASRPNPQTWMQLPPRQRGVFFDSFSDHRRMFADYFAHPNFDAYWKQLGFFTEDSYKKVKDVPALFLSGWYDYFLEGTLKNYLGLKATQKSEKKLIVGPWPHGTGRAECGDAAFGPSAAYNDGEWIADWFDHVWNASPFRVLPSDAVSLFRMGGGGGGRSSTNKWQNGGEWVGHTAWPPVQSKSARYFFSAGATLHTAAPKIGGSVSYVYDPANPVPTVGGRYTVGAAPPCAQDQRPLDNRADVLRFSTAALDQPLDIAGKVRVRMFVSTNAPDTDFTAKLIDVYPDGYAMILADHQLRLRFRESFERPKLFRRGDVEAIEFDLGSLSNRFAKGHRIRLDVSSSNFPKFEPNANTGEDPTSTGPGVKATNRVFWGAAQSSYLELPVLTSKQ
ncbi:MAG: CocE/NonD family hydrolase [Candidatus Solibacter usitatus]|nr:CocE/NonD family hydrolase [Candidatus Solibacter usitatus]